MQKKDRLAGGDAMLPVSQRAPVTETDRRIHASHQQFSPKLVSGALLKSLKRAARSGARSPLVRPGKGRMGAPCGNKPAAIEGKRLKTALMTLPGSF